MNKLKTKPFVLSITSFVVILYLVCAILILIAPGTTLSVFSNWFHGIDLTKIAKMPTISEVVIGLITSIIATVIFSAIFVAIWNKFNRRED